MTKVSPMAPFKSRVQSFIFHCIAPVACSIVIGYLFYGAHVFNRYSPGFQFLWSATVATVFYYLLLYVRPRDAYLGLALMFGLTFLTTGSTRTAFIVRDILYFAAIGSSVVLYVRYFLRGAHVSLGYPAVVLAGLYSLTYVVLSELHFGILLSSGLESTGGSFMSVALSGAFFGTLIGCALGIGITLSEKLFGPVPKSG